MSTAADSATHRRAEPVPAAPAPSRARLQTVLLAVGIALAAVNLRPVVTSLGPLLDDVRADLGMSAGVAGLLTAVPSLCFALFGLAAPALARRIGPIAVVAAGMGAITLGVLARSYAAAPPSSCC
ncbi:hypothetical protein ACFQ1I_32325 [Kitasatospora arboriphila]